MPSILHGARWVLVYSGQKRRGNVILRAQKNIGARSSLVDLWQMTAPLSWVFFVIVDCHFVAMSPLCIWFLPDFVDCLLLFFLWIVSTCVFICLVLLMDGFPSLIFIHGVFFKLDPRCV